MKINRLISEIDDLKSIIARWNKVDRVPEIERDAVLTNLQEIYKEVLIIGIEVDHLGKKESDARFCNALEAEAVSEDDSPEIEVELVVYEESDDDKEEEEDSTEFNLNEEDSEDSQSRHIAAERANLSDRTATEESQFDKITTEYKYPNQGTTEEGQSEKATPEYEKPDQTTEHKQPDLTATGVKSQAEEERVVWEEQPEEVMLFGQSVSQDLVDNFVRELFMNDDTFFDNEVTKLAAQPDFESALFYISEKYNWNARSKTAEIFTELLAGNNFE